MGKIIGITGPSNSGKTSFIVSFMKKYPEYRYLVIKHDPKDKAIFDTPGKDSHLFFSSGGDTVVLSPKKSTFFYHGPKEIAQVIEKNKAYDFIFIEGLKENPYPKLGIFFKEIQKEYLSFCIGFVIRDRKSVLLKKEADCFYITDFLDDASDNFWEDIRNWILRNGETIV